MSITVEIFKCRFPEFVDDVDYPEIRIQMFIDDAILFIGTNETRWLGKYNLALAYLTAHFLTLGSASEVGDTSSKEGSITTKSAGGVSVGRTVTPKDRSETDTLLMGSLYGQQFLSIRNSCFVGVSVATGCL